MKVILRILGVFVCVFMAGFSQIATAQHDEVIVTGTRIKSDAPGVYLEKRGDFLLLEVVIENDSRVLSTRIAEMNTTIEAMINAAKDHPEITLSLVDENDFVRPLTRSAFYDEISGGRRPDTSVAYIKVKTSIPDKVEDSYKLAQKLALFVESISVTGRTTIRSNDEIAVSIVNPYQYRDELVGKVLKEIKYMTSTLGDDYRVVIKGIDRQVKWGRAGDLNLSFYIDYSYEILPDSLAIYIDKNAFMFDD